MVPGILAMQTFIMYSALHVPSGDPALDVSAMQHFEDKLIHIKDRLKTQPGRELGEKRHKVVCIEDQSSSYLC
jgi:hypothetical protein